MGFILALAVSAPPFPALGRDRDPALERGIRHVEAGEWTFALKELSDAVRRLVGDHNRAPEAAEACLYSGLAYVGLGETSPAISQFALALRLDPQVQIPTARETPAARDAFEVARREAVAPAEPKAKGRSRLPFVLAGAAAVGGGIALAAGGGGSGESETSNPVPPVFTVTGTTGSPALLLLSATPGSSSTISLRQTAPILAFTFRYEPTLPERVLATVEMRGPLGTGPCITGRTGEITEIDPAVAAPVVVVNSWNITCPPSFITTTMSVRLVDADTNQALSITSYTGGYIFQP